MQEIVTSKFPGARRVAFHTLGCKLNHAETGAISASFARAGFELAEMSDGPDIVVINSCTVTENADRECRQLVRRALRSNPHAFVVVTGCYAQLQPEEIASIDGVDLVVGTAGKHRLLSIEDRFEKRSTPRVVVDNPEGDDFGVGFTGGVLDRTRAYLKVQDGCDYSCSFCTIPLARGGSRSLAAAGVIDQAQMLVRQGFVEIILTGVNVGDYSSHGAGSLAELLRMLERVDGLQRLRVSSIEPNLLTDEIIEIAVGSDRMLPHFHVPLQSGSDRLLRAMRRRYQRDLYEKRVHKVLEALPDASIGVDVIVGFPGEQEEDFHETYLFLSELPVAYLHVFTYSERENTPAASYGGAVPVEERRRRTAMLRSLSMQKHVQFVHRQLGSVRRVLFESGGGGFISGYTDNYVRVRVGDHPALAGTIQQTRLVGFDGEIVAGKLVDVPEGGSLNLPVVGL